MKLEDKIRLAVEEATKVLSLTPQDGKWLALVLRETLLTPIPKMGSYGDFNGETHQAQIVAETTDGRWVVRVQGGYALMRKEDVVIG